LHDFSTLAPAIEDLGTRHAGYGTKTEHYKILRKVLLWALNKGLGDAFTPEIRAAWIKVYNALAATMQAGAAEAAAIRVA
jgi:nitric oxide dioxygenase